MNIFKINTTAFEEEDFYIITDLQKDQVHTAIRNFVVSKRNSNEDYNNYDLIRSIMNSYPNANVVHFNEIKTISI